MVGSWLHRILNHLSYFDQYNPYVLDAANQYSIPAPILQGLITTESGWNPFAVGDGGAAFGFGQLHAGAASDVNVNRFDPVGNIFGSASYLSKMPGVSWMDKLAHYNQGPGASITSKGLDYANKVMNAADKFINSPLGKLGEKAGLAFATGGGSLLASGGLGIGGTSDWVSEIRDWILKSGFFQRLALALVALILILGAIYTLKGKAT